MVNYYINGRGKEELTQQIIAIIRRARKCIKAANFLFQDKRILDELEAALTDRGVALFIISNLRGAENDSYNREMGESDEKIDNHLLYLKRLWVKGAHVHILNDLHAKFIIADDGSEEEAGLLMSANFSPCSINKNTETGISVENEELKDLVYVFDKLYLNADMNLLDESNGRNQVNSTRKPLPKDAFAHLNSRLRLTIASRGTMKGNQESTNLKNCEVNTIYNSIVDIINGAQDYLYIVSWVFKLRGLEELMSALKRAHERNVRLFFYANLHGRDSKRNNEEARETLQKYCSFSWEGDGDNHSKCVLSEKEGIIFTANIDGGAGMKSGFEVGCILDDVQRKAVYDHITSLINSNHE
ncbi:phospholipase D-like domain-containing protein [Bacteroides fluxus]|uniref:phospholipase D-like domain-containing protein n=1 Tax=Bacteroides fluxus TaxID=626930 RepID=UPI0023521E76|nr:phospholipase D-like domain-containing protein [Bacteroides fluxus]